MVDWSSTLDLFRAALDVSDHAIGYRVFRTFYGVLLCLFVLGYAGVCSAVWGEEAVWKRSGFVAHRLRPFGFFDFLPERTAGTAAIACGALSGGLLTFSKFPAGYLVLPIWGSLCSLQGRNAFMCYGGDDVLRLLALAFILDFSSQTPPPSLLLAQVLMLSIYWNTAIYKLREPAWQRGEALYGFANMSMVSRIRPRPYWNRRIVVQTLTYAALVVELLIAPLLLFKQTVVVGCVLALGLHAVMHTLFRIHLFQLVMVCGIALFPSDSWYRQVGEWIGW
ncbi:MAG: HTTM domain-containing protein [Planctomycetaceae bacterium]|nr:HTTM domain-containing protein [Planctomycetales bacterium]MCB9923388.1 HTTM domain-containing protein [Planctomycetaceae bacterium]